MVLYTTKHKSGVFFFRTTKNCELNPQNHHLKPPKPPPQTPKTTTYSRVTIWF